MPRQERERRYIAEYMKETWPEGNWQLNVELGPIHQEYVQRYGLTRAAALFRPTRPRVDAIKWSDDKYYIIEAKVRDIKTGVGDLMYYMAQAKITADLPYYDGQPIIARLVVPYMLDWLLPAAAAAGVEVTVYWQDWIENYVRERQHYFSADYRDARKQKMRDREALGLE